MKFSWRVPLRWLFVHGSKFYARTRINWSAITFPFRGIRSPTVSPLHIPMDSPLMVLHQCSHTGLASPLLHVWAMFREMEQGVALLWCLSHRSLCAAPAGLMRPMYRNLVLRRTRLSLCSPGPKVQRVHTALTKPTVNPPCSVCGMRGLKPYAQWWFCTLACELSCIRRG